MNADDFRRRGHEMIDWIADYWERVETLPVTPDTRPGDVRARLPKSAPESPEPFDDILRDIDDIVVPALAHWQSPNWFAFFPSNVSPPSVLGELLSAGLGVQGMLWATSPAATELETHVLDWLAELLGLPEAFQSGPSGKGPGGGVILDTASSATLCALLAARERATGGTAARDGVDHKLCAYASADAHSSVEKAMGIAGLGRSALRQIPTREDLSMSPQTLEAHIQKDRRDGKIPCFVTATLGTTAALAFDPLPEIAEICRREGVWLHVDAAMAGNATICPEHRWMNEGLDGADSYCVNPHKWLLTNFDCDAFYVKDRMALISALSILPEYLKNTATESGHVIDYRDWQIPLGRRFRALKLWMVLRSYGADGLRAMVRRHVALAAWLKERIAADERFELAADVHLNLVCFRLRSGELATRRLLDAVNATRRVYLTHATLGGRLAIRLCVGQARTEARHVEAAWALLAEQAAKIEAPDNATNSG